MPFKSKIIKIDSSKASQFFNAYQTNFLFTIDPPITVTNDEVIVYSLVNAWIPYSFYSVNQYNQYLDVRIVRATVAPLNMSVIQNVYTKTIIIPAGNYSTYDFAKTLASLLNASYSGVANMSATQFTVTYNKINNTFAIGYASSLTTAGSRYYAQLMLQTGAHASVSCRKLLGCPMQDITIDSGTTLATNLVVMNDLAYFQIRTDIGESNTIITGDDQGNLLEIIPVSSEPLSYISYSPFQANKFLLHNTSLNVIRIGLVDNYGRDVDLNGIPFLLTIKIDVVSAEEAGLPLAIGRNADDFEGQQAETNLQIIGKDPRLIARATDQEPLSVADLIEYRLIQKELANIKKQMNEKKKKNTKK